MGCKPMQEALRAPEDSPPRHTRQDAPADLQSPGRQPRVVQPPDTAVFHETAGGGGGGGTSWAEGGGAGPAGSAPRASGRPAPRHPRRAEGGACGTAGTPRGGGFQPPWAPFPLPGGAPLPARLLPGPQGGLASAVTAAGWRCGHGRRRGRGRGPGSAETPGRPCWPDGSGRTPGTPARGGSPRGPGEGSAASPEATGQRWWLCRVLWSRKPVPRRCRIQISLAPKPSSFCCLLCGQCTFVQ